MDEVTLAFASVVSSSILGAAGLGIGVWGPLKAAKDAEKARRAERSAGAYLDLVRLAQREGRYYEVLVANLQITREDEYAGDVKEEYPELPNTKERMDLDANLAAFASREVLALYAAWRETILGVAGERAALEFAYYDNYIGPDDTPVGDLTRMIGTLLPAERAARLALADRVAFELGHRPEGD